MAAFAITRILATIRVPVLGTSTPTGGESPFDFISTDLLQQLLVNGAVSGVAFSAAAYFLEMAFAAGLVTKFPGVRRVLPFTAVEDDLENA